MATWMLATFRGVDAALQLDEYEQRFRDVFLAATDDEASALALYASVGRWEAQAYLSPAAGEAMAGWSHDVVLVPTTRPEPDAVQLVIGALHAVDLTFPELALEERHRIMETVDYPDDVRDAWAEHCDALGLYLPPKGYEYLEDRAFLDA